MLVGQYINRWRHMCRVGPEALVAAALSGLALCKIWNRWVSRGDVDASLAAAAALGLAVLLGGLLSKPPLACAECGSLGWSRDLDPANPLCPHCGADSFVTVGRYGDAAETHVGTVLGLDIVSGAFSVRREERGGGDGHG